MSTVKTRKDIKGNKSVPNSEPVLFKSSNESDLFERSNYILDLINGWIVAADSKISTSGGIISVVVAVFVFVAENVLSKVNTAKGAIEPWKTFFIMTAVGTLISFLVSLYYHFRALSPNFFTGKSNGEKGKKKKCNIFYENIKDYNNTEEYISAIKNMSEDQFVNDILSEVYCNSDICSQKMHNFQIGLWFAFLTIVLILLCSLCYFQMYHH